MDLKNPNPSNLSNTLPLEVASLADRLTGELGTESEQRWLELASESSRLLTGAISGPDETLANKAWFLSKVIEMRREYLACIAELRAAKYYDAWCRLEQIEIGLATIRKNAFYDCEKFGVIRLAQQVANWQSLYPYSLFFSPEHIIRREECSICGEVVGPWSSCSHLPSQVYFGKECYRIIRDFEVISVSIVRDPVQKYSVARVLTENELGQQVDQFDYSPVKFVIDRLREPFSEWHPRWTERFQPHALFQDVPAEASCPCNSQRLYGDCCLTMPGVRMPHVDIIFEKHPPSHLPTLVESAKMHERIVSQTPDQSQT